MAYSNSRIKVGITTGSDVSYLVQVNGSTVFSGVFCCDSYGAHQIDITEILRPYVHPNEITSLASGSGPTSASYLVTGMASFGSASGVVNYLNDFATASIPNPLRPQDWGLDKIDGQYYFSYTAQGAWYGSAYGSAPDTCQYNAEIVFTDIFGMPQGVPVRIVTATQCEWTGYMRAQDYQSSRHRTVPTAAAKQMAFTCYTPYIREELRKRLVRWLGQSEYVYLYDIEEGQLHPCVTPQLSDSNLAFDKLTVNLVTDY